MTAQYFVDQFKKHGKKLRDAQKAYYAESDKEKRKILYYNAKRAEHEFDLLLSAADKVTVT